MAPAHSARAVSRRLDDRELSQAARAKVRDQGPVMACEICGVHVNLRVVDDGVDPQIACYGCARAHGLALPAPAPLSEVVQ